jgi:ArsR family metal-binding transcriptional regulator
VTRLKWKLILVRLEVVPILTQDRCTVCAERTIASVRTHPMELLGDVGHLESCFGPFEDGVSEVHVCAEHTIGSEIVLDAPDGTPR